LKLKDPASIEAPQASFHHQAGSDGYFWWSYADVDATWASRPCEVPVDVVPLVSKDPKEKYKHKKQSHQDHRSGSGEHSGHREGTSEEKRLK